ncbi:MULTISPECIES: lipid A deacylase LpxR family protein [unclassified Luteimonas]
MAYRPILTSALLLLASALAPPVAFAADTTGAGASGPIVNLRIDNDMFAGDDQGYTSGVQFTVVSPNLSGPASGDNLPRLPGWLDNKLAFLHGRNEDAEQRNLVLRIEQRIYTPEDPTRTDPIKDDRPYAGTLMATLGYNVRSGDSMHTTLLGVGMLGPASGARQSQQFIHDLIGSDKFQGWEHQLGNELMLGLRHERAYRLGTWDLGSGRLQHDVITHWGGAIGNPMTRLNGGFELRLGHDLPDDFGSSPVRPSGDNTAPLDNGGSGPGWAWHAFLAVDGYWSIHDPSLDGNLFRSSHSVDKDPLVAEAAVGISITRGHWKLAFARYFRTREFSGQRERPKYGSMTISRAF